MPTIVWPSIVTEPMPERLTNNGIQAQVLTLSALPEAGDWTGISSIDTRLKDLASVISQWPGLVSGPAVATVVLSNDEKVRSLNATYRGKNKSTNVLSFPADQSIALPGEDVMELGDVILANETVLKESEEAGIAPEDHFSHLVVHGVLHLLGYDHKDDATGDQMERLEAKILAVVGIPDPYRTYEVNTTTNDPLSSASSS